MFSFPVVVLTADALVCLAYAAFFFAAPAKDDPYLPAPPRTSGQEDATPTADKALAAGTSFMRAVLIVWSLFWTLVFLLWARDSFYPKTCGLCWGVIWGFYGTAMDVCALFTYKWEGRNLVEEQNGGNGNNMSSNYPFFFLCEMTLNIGILLANAAAICSGRSSEGDGEVTNSETLREPLV